MKKTLSKTLSLIAFLIFGFTVNAQETVAKKHMMWEVSNAEGVQGYLVGSMHFAEPSLYPLDTLYYQVLMKSNPIVFELNLDSMQAGKIQLLQKLAFYPAGETLSQNIPDTLFQKVDKKMKAIGFPMTQKIKPWFAAMTLMAINAQKGGLTQEGIDQHFFDIAKKKDKTIVGLETAEQQMSIFADLSKEKQIKLLVSTVNQKENDKENDFYDKITKYWKTGDAEATIKLLDTEMGETGDDDISKELLTNRNQNWRIQLEKMFKAGKRPMVIVGLAHLVGDDNVVNMLIEDGYRVKQM